jgi:hypothetical protein
MVGLYSLLEPQLPVQSLGLEREAGLDIFTFWFKTKVGIICVKSIDFYTLLIDLKVLSKYVYSGEEETGGSK